MQLTIDHKELYSTSLANIFSSFIFPSLAFFSFYILLRLPYFSLPDFTYGIFFLDDGETLYHLKALYASLVPYRDDVTHHFLGYLISYLFLEKIFNSPQVLLFVTALLHQLISALAIFSLTFKISNNRALAFLSGLTFLAALEPYALGYPPIAQLTSLILLTFCALLNRSGLIRLLGSLVFGVALTFDQRAIFFTPLFIYQIWRKEKKLISPRHFIAMLLVPFSMLFYLFINSAVKDWFKQTIIYPLFHRNCGTWGNSNFLALEAPLFYLYLLALLTIIIFIVKRPAILTFEKSLLASLAFLASLLSVLAGGREFTYYHYPLIAFATVIISALARLLERRERFPLFYSLFLFLALFPTTALINSFTLKFPPLKSDLSLLSATLAREDPLKQKSFYIWGYRPDLYIKLNRLSASRFMNRQMVHPDQGVRAAKDRACHVMPQLLESFISEWNSDKPELVLLVESKFSSQSEIFIKESLAKDYHLIAEFKETLLNQKVEKWQLFRYYRYP
jgi:hypothetical protein